MTTRIMYDSVNANAIPASALMVAGYSNGIYAWHPSDWARFPNAVKVRITINAGDMTAHVADVETFDLMPQDGFNWVMEKRKLGQEATLYVNRSNIDTVRGLFTAAKQPQPYYWIATLDGLKLELGGDTVACQYAGEKINKANYDLSTVIDFWPGIDTQKRGNTVLTSSMKWNIVRGWYAEYLGYIFKTGAIDPGLPHWADQIQDDGTNVDAVHQHFIDSAKQNPDFIAREWINK